MPDVHGIIAEAGAELAAYLYAEPVREDRITWRGKALGGVRPEKTPQFSLT
jgi:hypothetical protein